MNPSFLRFMKITRREWEVVFKTALVAPRLQRQLRTHGYNHARRWLDARSDTGVGSDDVPTVVRACEAAMRRMPLHFSCLDRSLILWWLLGGDERAGIRLGVAASLRPPFATSLPRLGRGRWCGRQRCTGCCCHIPTFRGGGRAAARELLVTVEDAGTRRQPGPIFVWGPGHAFVTGFAGPNIP